MDYKKIIKSRKTREAILRALCFVPDKTMLKLQYRIHMGEKLDLKKPQRFTEKMQWYKIHYRNPDMIKCVDKYEVRDYIKGLGMDEILNDCYGVYENADEVDFSALPESFVIKDTLGSGGNSVIIIDNKADMDENAVRNSMREWTKVPLVRDGGREWPYYSGKTHRILIEKLIESNEPNSLIDYKFFCFDGKVEFAYVMGNRDIGSSVSVSVVDRDFNILPVLRVGDSQLEDIQKPEKFDEMISIAEDISKNFPHVRVDLYDVDGKVVFGELTFFNASGYMKYNPDSFDFEIGKKFVLPQEKNEC